MGFLNTKLHNALILEILNLLKQASSEGGTFYVRDKRDPKYTLKPLDFNPLDLHKTGIDLEIVNFLIDLKRQGYAIYLKFLDQPLIEVTILEPN